MLAAVVAEGLAIALLGLLVAGLLRSHAQILRALHDLGAGLAGDGPDRAAGAVGAVPVAAPTLHRGGLTPPSGDDAAHDVVGTRLDGTAAALGVVGARHDTLLAFLSTGCTTCQPFWSAFAGPVSVPGDARLVVVVQDDESESRLRALAGSQVDVIASTDAWNAYGVPGSPHFVYIDGPAGRVVGEGTASTWDQIRDLLGQAGDDRRLRAGRATAPASDPRDNAERVDAELLAAGIGPGHHSLYAAPDEPSESAPGVR